LERLLVLLALAENLVGQSITCMPKGLAALASRVPFGQHALGLTIKKSAKHGETTYLDENLPTLTFGRHCGPCTLVEGVLDVV